MRVIVFGATGKVGRLVVAELLRRGHEVTAFVHSKKPDDQPNLTVFKGDIYDRETIEQAVPGHDAVISALGSWGTDKKNVLSSAMQRIVPAAEASGISRLISVTGSGAGVAGEKSGLVLRLSRLMLGIVAPKVLRDSEDHIAIIANSSLNWTVVRSGGMTNQDYDGYVLDARRSSALMPRQAVVNAMVDLAESGEWPRRAPFVRKS